MSSYERNTGTGCCAGWCHKHCNCQGANPVGSSQTRIDQGQYEPVNSDARGIMEIENERNPRKALQNEKATASDLDIQNQRSTWRAKGTQQSDARVVAERKQQVSKMEDASRRQKQETKGLEAKVAGLSQRLREETETSRQFEATVTELNERLREEKEASRESRRKETELNQRLRECRADAEASRRKEKALEVKATGLSQRLREEMEASRRKEKGLEAKVTELSQRLRGETETSRRREKETKRQETKIAELTEAFRRKERDMEQQKAEIVRRLHETTVKLSKQEEVARQSARKERESKRLNAELGLCLIEKTVKLANIEASRRKSRKGESRERLEVKVTELEAKLSVVEDDARRREHELSETNEKQRDEINQLKARVKTLVEQANRPLLRVLVCKPDTIAMVDVEELVRILNSQIEQVSSRITDQLYYRESPGSGTESAALNDLRDYLGPWLFEALRRRLHESNPLIPQIALQTVLVQASSRIINHWNPPFWNDNLIFFRVNSHMGGAGHIAGTWSALARTLSQSEVQEANVKYLSEMVVKVIAAVGGPLPNGQSLPPEHQEDVEDIVKRALEFRQIVSKEVKSTDLITYTVPSETPFDPSQMDDTEGYVDATGCDRVVCTLHMGLQYRKKAQLGKGQQGLTLKPKVVLPVALVEA